MSKQATLYYSPNCNICKDLISFLKRMNIKNGDGFTVAPPIEQLAASGKLPSFLQMTPTLIVPNPNNPTQAMKIEGSPCIKWFEARYKPKQDASYMQPNMMAGGPTTQSLGNVYSAEGFQNKLAPQQGIQDYDSADYAYSTPSSFNYDENIPQKDPYHQQKLDALFSGARIMAKDADPMPTNKDSQTPLHDISGLGPDVNQSFRPQFSNQRAVSGMGGGSNYDQYFGGGGQRNNSGHGGGGDNDLEMRMKRLQAMRDNDVPMMMGRTG